MYIILNSYRDNNDTTFYAIKDFSDSTSDIEVVSESDLKLLIATNLEANTQSGENVVISGGSLICNVDDVTEQLNAQMEESSDSEDDDYDYDFYDDDDEDEVVDEESDSEDDEDYYGDYAFYGDEEDEVEDAEGSIVSKLYALLSEEQVKVLKRYYLWYSQRIFTDAQKDPTYGFKSKSRLAIKKGKLNTLKGDGDWRYAGWLDTGGTQYGYTCTLGHPLRYLHLAWDITIGDIEECFFGEEYNVDYEKIINSNHCIVFGSKCIGDFFEVDKDCVTALRRTQTDSLKDMAILYDIYSNEGVETASKSFELLDGIMEKIYKKDTKGRLVKSDYNEMLPSGMELLYKQFRELGMIPPKSLIQEIRSTLVGWTDGSRYFLNKWTGCLKYPTFKINEVIKTLVDKQTKSYFADLDYQHLSRGYATDISSILEAFITVMFVYEICGIYKYDADTQKDEGGRSKPVKAELASLYSMSMCSVFSDLNYDTDTLTKLAYVCKELVSFGTFWRYSTYKFEYPVEGSDCDTMSASVLDEHDLGVTDTLVAFKEETGVDVLTLVSDLKSYFSFMQRMCRNSGNYSKEKFKDKFTLDANMYFSLNEVYTKVHDTLESFKQAYNQLLTWSEVYKERKFAEVKQKNEAERLEKEEQMRLAKEEEEKRIAEEQKAKEQNNLIDTPMKVVNYLLNSDLSSLSKDWDLPKNILETVKRSGKEPSDRQFYHIRRLYKEVSGVDYEGVGQTKRKEKLTDSPEMEKAIDYILANTDLAKACIPELAGGHKADETKFLNILQSIKKWGTMSENQLPYAQAALVVYNKEVN